MQVKLLSSEVLFSAKCSKYCSAAGLPLYPLVGAYSAPADPLAGLREPTCKGRAVEKRERDGRGWAGREGDTLKSSRSLSNLLMSSCLSVM